MFLDCVHNDLFATVEHTVRTHSGLCSQTVLLSSCSDFHGRTIPVFNAVQSEDPKINDGFQP